MKSKIKEIIRRETFPEGDYLTFTVEDGRSFRRKMTKTQLISPNPKMCDISGNTISTGDLFYSIPVKKKGLSKIYISENYLDGDEMCSDPLVKALETLSEGLTLSFDKILKEQDTLDKDVKKLKLRKEMISQANSAAHQLKTKILKLEGMGLL